MRLLIIGGSTFLGRAFAVEALEAGHTVTVFNRGKSGADVPGVEAVRGDRESPDDLARLVDGREWDGVVDTCGYVPSVVGLSARALAGHAPAYLFVSSVSALAAWPHEPASDSSAAFECSPDAGAEDGEYGVLKAGCERAVERDFTGRVVVLRPGLVLGPHENVGRLPTWLLRIARAGADDTADRRVLAPGDPNRPIALIDARDIALFGLRCLLGDAQGSYIVSGPPASTTFGAWLQDCVDVTGSSAELVWADDGFLLAHEVGQWSELPLWAPADEPDVRHIWNVDSGRAEAAGLRCRPIRETVEDTWSWLSADGGRLLRTYQPTRPHGLAPERERALLAAWDGRSDG